MNVNVYALALTMEMHLFPKKGGISATQCVAQTLSVETGGE